MPTPYKVKHGDTLSKIAHQHGMTWQELYHDPSNESFRRQRTNPNLIYPGDTVMIPGRSSVAPVPSGSTTHAPVNPPPHAPVKLFFTLSELQDLLNKSNPQESDLDRALRKAMKEIGPGAVSNSNSLDDLAKRIQKHMELRAGGYVIKPDYPTIFKGLKELLKH